MTDQPARLSIAEIAALTRRLRELSRPGRAPDRGEVQRFRADKNALLDRITAADDDARDQAADRAADDRAASAATELIGSASWAIAARDAAYERGDGVAADRFSAEAAEAIAAAQRAGVSLAELAYELDYPGGVDAMLDGSSDEGELHVHGAVGNPALIEDAARYADHVGVDPDPWADYRVYSPAEAAASLVARGVPPDQAPGMVERYVDSMTADRGWPASQDHQWQIDDDDLAAMTDDQPDRPTPGDALDREFDERHPLPEFELGAGGRGEWVEPEVDRRDQLRRWEFADDDERSVDGVGRTEDTDDDRTLGRAWSGTEDGATP